jgi:hypothetical protein
MEHLVEIAQLSIKYNAAEGGRNNINTFSPQGNLIQLLFALQLTLLPIFSVYFLDKD